MADEIQLRGGYVTTDPRLGRLPQPDPRNQNFPIRTLITPAQAIAPRSYTWSLDRRLDQQMTSACVGYSWTHELRARPSVVENVSTQFAFEEVYLEAQKIDEWEGGEYPGASPQYGGTSVLAGAKVLHGRGFFESYRWAFTLDELVLAVGYKGPVVMGTWWYSSMFSPDADGTIHVQGVIEGGHAWLARGVSLPKRRFLCTNSWGPGWGLSGDFYVSFEDMARLLREDGEACIPVKRFRALT